MTLRTILIGGGGHCRAVLDVLDGAGDYRPIGIVDELGSTRRSCNGLPVVGTDADLSALTDQADVFVLAIGQTTSADARQRLGRQLIKLGASTPAIVSRTAHVSSTATLADGCVVMHAAVVNAGAAIGRFGIVNTGCIVEHDVTVGDYCHVSTAAVINGGATVGKRVFVGSNSVVREGVRIGDDAVIAAGAIVVGDVAAGLLVKGLHR